MKNIFVLAACAVFSLSACKKDSSDNPPASSLSASFDGGIKSFNNSLVGSVVSNSGLSSMQLVGFAGAVGSSDALYVTVLRDSPITTGTYADGQGATIVYVSQAGGMINYTNAVSATNPISITITSISTTNVTGTFEGEIFVDGGSSGDKKVLTNGRFNVNLQ